MSSLNLSSILLVDDDQISHIFNKIFIEKLNLNVEVDFVLNGKEALELLIPSEGHSTIVLPCLLLLDLNMPIMNGWEFLKAYEEQLSPEIQDKITIAVLTTSMLEVDMVKAIENPNVKEYIEKPLTETALRRVIKKYFSKTEMDH